MTTLPAVATLSRDEARSLTDEVKHDAERLWRKLVELYEGGAHETLGYESWRAYWIAEFGEQSLNLSYKQIAAGRVARVIEAAPVYRGTKPTERQARELAPLLDEPEQLREAWTEASANGAPSARDVRKVVQRRRPKPIVIDPSDELLERQQRETLINSLDRALFALSSPPSTAHAEAQRLLAGGDAGPLTPSRFERVIEYATAFCDSLREAGVDG